LLRWYDRSGQVLKTLGEPEFAAGPRLDSQGTLFLVTLFDPRTHAGDLWSLDLEHGTRTRESFHDRPGGDAATWTANGERIVYSALQGTQEEMFIKNAGSSDNGRMLQTGLNGSKIISDLSPDGNSIFYLYQTETGTETSIYGQSLVGGKAFLIGPAVEDEMPRLSPDGSWMALPSNESGPIEIIGPPSLVPRAVQRFPSAVVTILDGAATARNSFIEPMTGTSLLFQWLTSNSAASVSRLPFSGSLRERNPM